MTTAKVIDGTAGNRPACNRTVVPSTHQYAPTYGGTEFETSVNQGLRTSSKRPKDGEDDDRHWYQLVILVFMVLSGNLVFRGCGMRRRQRLCVGRFIR